MKYFGHLLTILIFNHLHVDAVKFNCTHATPMPRNTDFLRYLHGKVYWIVKFLGYPKGLNEETEGEAGFEDFRPFTYNRVKYFPQVDLLRETNYFIKKHGEIHGILEKRVHIYEIHDELLALKAIKSIRSYINYTLIPYEGFRLTKPYDEKDIIMTRRWMPAYIHYDAEFDFYVIQSCTDEKQFATIEIGDKDYKEIIKGNEDKKTKFVKKVLKAITALNLTNDGNFEVPNYVLDMFSKAD